MIEKFKKINWIDVLYDVLNAVIIYIITVPFMVVLYTLLERGIGFHMDVEARKTITFCVSVAIFFLVYKMIPIKVAKDLTIIGTTLAIINIFIAHLMLRLIFKDIYKGENIALILDYMLMCFVVFPFITYISAFINSKLFKVMLVTACLIFSLPFILQLIFP